MTAHDWDAIERGYRAGQLSIKELAREHKLSDTAIHKRAKAKGWTRDLSRAVRTRVCESPGLRGGLRKPDRRADAYDAAIIDEAAAIGVAVVRSHRRDIDALRQAAAELLRELRAPTQRDEDRVLVVVPLIHRSRVIADLSSAMARLVPLERQAFGLDEDRPGGSQPITVIWEGMQAPAYD